MGKCVKIVTDECNEEVLLIATATSDLIRSFGSSRLTLESFPPQANFDSGDVQRLKECAEWADSVIAIERPGPNSDGEYKTMKGISMDHLVAPLEDIIGYRMNLPGNIISDFNNIDADGDVDVESKEKPINYSFLSIGIGDGGNEIGMGKVYDKIINSSSIPLGKDIACVVATKYLLTSSVSNWGGYAVAAALCIHHIRSQSQFHSPSIYRQFRRDSVSKYIVSPETEVKICTSMVESGARDGVSGQMEVSVDGMPFSVSIQVLNDLVILCLSESIVWS